MVVLGVVFIVIGLLITLAANLYGARLGRRTPVTNSGDFIRTYTVHGVRLLGAFFLAAGAFAIFDGLSE